MSGGPYLFTSLSVSVAWHALFLILEDLRIWDVVEELVDLNSHSVCDNPYEVGLPLYSIAYHMFQIIFHWSRFEQDDIMLDLYDNLTLISCCIYRLTLRLYVAYHM